jgi:RNA polymerase sigma factor (TIGR02999 family)
MDAADKPDATQITGLLKAWGGGDQAAMERLAPLISAELRRMARHYMRGERDGHTLQATALVNEAWIRLINLAGENGAAGGNGAVNWKDRAHFFAVSAQMMRRILVDSARARRSDKRGGAALRLNLDDSPELGSSKDRELVALDDALNALAQLDPRKAKVIELRFFGGLSVEETAEVLKISEPSVLRDWKLARAWLQREMKKE